MSNPEWAINLLDRSESILGYFRRSALSSSSSLSSISERLRRGLVLSDLPVPFGQMYHSLEHCIIANFVEGCAIGGTIGVIVSVLPALLKGKVRTAGKSVVTLGNARVGLFFGALMTVCNTGVYLQSRRPDATEYKRIRILIGLLSGCSVAILPKATRRFIVFFLLTRSFEVLIRIWKVRKLADIEDEDSLLNISTREDLFSVHEIAFLTCSSMTVIITGWFRYPELVPQAYLHFLRSINNLAPCEVDNITTVLRHECVEQNRLDLVPVYTGPLCQLIHSPSQYCLDFYIRFLLKGIVTRSGPFYLKLYSLPLIVSLVRRRGAVSSEFILAFVNRVWRSALFLATMNATVAGTCCVMGHGATRLGPLVGVPQLISQTAQMSVAGAACGLSIYIEQEPRRLELALYLFSQAVQVLAAAWTAKVAAAPRGMDILVSATSIGIVTYAFWELKETPGAPQLLRPGYANLMSKIIDTRYVKHNTKSLNC